VEIIEQRLVVFYKGNEVGALADAEDYLDSLTGDKSID
jgi:hypothetical protein